MLLDLHYATLQYDVKEDRIPDDEEIERDVDTTLFDDEAVSSLGINVSSRTAWLRSTDRSDQIRLATLEKSSNTLGIPDHRRNDAE